MLRPILSALALLSLAQAPAQASTMAVKFYKTSRSPFPSGEASLRDLEKNWLRDEAEFSYLVQRDKKQFWVKADSVARDLQLSTYVFSNRLQQTFKVIEVQGSSLLGLSTHGGDPQWLSFADLTPLPEDPGCALTLTSTLVREQPSWKSDSVMHLPAGSRLQILKIEDTWAQVNFESVGQISGWVDLSNLLLKSDFAAFVMTDKQKWMAVLHRDGSELITAENHHIPLSKVKGLMTRPDLAISLVSDDSQKLLLRQNLTLLKTDAQAWSLSKISGHGEVYWKKNFESPKPEMLVQDGIPIEELMKREVVSLSFHPKNPNFGVVSAHGIFLTTDGKIWKKISQFGEQDFPVLLDSQNVLYVGAQRSTDLGRSFSPYFRWELLAHLLEQKQKSAVQQLKIKNLTSPRPGILEMVVETNLGPLRLAARSDFGIISKWDFN